MRLRIRLYRAKRACELLLLERVVVSTILSPTLPCEARDLRICFAIHPIPHTAGLMFPLGFISAPGQTSINPYSSHAGSAVQHRLSCTRFGSNDLVSGMYKGSCVCLLI